MVFLSVDTVVVKSFSKPLTPPSIVLKLLDHLEKALEVLTKKQGEYPSPLFEKMKKDLCEEIKTTKKWHDSSEDVKAEVDKILEKYCADTENDSAN